MSNWSRFLACLLLLVLPLACSGTGDDDDVAGDCADGELGDDNDDDGWRTCGVAGLFDCDDNDPAVNPEMAESCGDDKDNDCSGEADDADVDEDGYVALECGGDDCLDTAAGAHPGALEACDSLDNDCDGEVDDGFDADNDGWSFCAGDCNNQDALINPDAEELCDGADNDCDCWDNNNRDSNDDGVDCGPGDRDVDEDFDGDADGYIDAVDAFCSGIYGLSGSHPQYGDCDDGDSATRPLSHEAQDGEDNDCDGCVDECQDADGDGADTCGTGDLGDASCPVAGEAGANDGEAVADCNDAPTELLAPYQYPGFTTTLQTQEGPVTVDEQCDQVDNDCDGTIDEGYDANCNHEAEGR